LNAVEGEPVQTRVFNPKANYVASYRKMKLKKKNLATDSPGAQMSSAQTAAPKRT